MNIYCKSGITKEQIEARRSLDKNGVELQLLYDFIESPKSTEEYIQYIGKDIESIKVIHVPLKSGEELLEIQMLSEEKYQNILNRVCALAQAIATKNKEKVLVVIHNSWDVDEYNTQRNIYNLILKYLSKLLELYPEVKIGIENVIPFMPKGVMRFRGGSLPSYIDVIRKLRDDLGTDRIGSVLDTCHAMVTIKTLRAICECSGLEVNIGIEDFYKENKGVCFLVHLCDVEGLGYMKSQHGTPFNSDNVQTLDLFMRMHKKYVPDTDITLEVLEPDYTNCENYKSSKKELDKMI